ncbi:MAG: HAMP domain-containing histidine kinase [Acidobacteria bacterium]|nr:HAMP domain-containing histidine kinase [Acidobacteriota bacterium]
MRRRKSTIFFLVLGICLIALAVALNVGWILLNLREVALMIFGIVFFALIITGLVLNTIFLIREIRRNEQHDAFLNAVTHELKTPITSIRLYLETLKTREVPPEKRREFYDVMLSDSNRLLNTVEQVLQASRTREKQRQLNITEIELGGLIEECVALAQTRYKLDETAIKLVRPAEAVKISGDASELQTVFTNLLDNAVKYSPDAPRISVRVRVSGDKRVRVFVKDNGIGLAPGDVKRIFKKFYRASNLRTQEKKGTGLGLFIVKAIVEKHGGRIWADSSGEGKGSTFIVQLPVR